MGWLLRQFFKLWVRAAVQPAEAPEALTAQAHSLGLDPLSEDAACEGEPGTNVAAVTWPVDPNRRKLCEAVRAEQRRAEERRRGRKIRGEPTD